MILSKICDLRFLLRSRLCDPQMQFAKFDRLEDENNFGRWVLNQK